MNKKGNFLDWFIVIALVFSFAVTSIISLYVVQVVITTGIFADDPVANNAISITERTLLSFDNMLLFVLVGLSIFVLVSSAFVFNHPAFFIVGFILLCIAVTVAAITSNAYYSFITQDTIASTAANFTKINFVMNKLPLYIAFMFFTTMAIMYVAYTKQ